MPKTTWTPIKRYARYIPSYGGFALETDSTIFATGRVYYMPLIVNVTIRIDRLGCMHGGTAAGNFYLAIYTSASEAPSERLAISNSTVSNGTHQKQQVNITPSELGLVPNLYYIALEVDNATDSYWQNQATQAAFRPYDSIINGPSFYYEDLGSYTEPPQTATPVQSVPGTPRSYLGWIRVVSVLA